MQLKKVKKRYWFLLIFLLSILSFQFAVHIERAPAIGIHASKPVNPGNENYVYKYRDSSDEGLSIKGFTFHKATYDPYYTEEGPIDHGGVLYLFIENNSPEAQEIDTISINGTSVENYITQGKIKWYRTWPEKLEPGEKSTITVKGVASPLSEGENIKIEIETLSGKHYRAEALLNTPPLRIGYYIFDKDMQTLSIFMRNTGTKTYAVNSVYLNGDISNSSSFLGGGNISPNKVEIVKVRLAQPVKILSPFSLIVSAKDDGGNMLQVGAIIKALEPQFAIGTWSSNTPDQELGMQYSRQLHLNVITGSTNFGNMEQMYEKYHIQSTTINNIGNPKRPNWANINLHKDSSFMHSWFIRDEPDLNGIPSGEIEKYHNRVIWQTDLNHPTFLNLCANRAFNEYGHIPDIIAMDHYVQYAPRINAKPLTPNLKEAGAYTYQLKINTEPKTLWTWSQLALKNTWYNQPDPWAVNVQFWSHIMYGAKGILWFKFGPEYKDKFPLQFEAAKRAVNTLSQVKDLLLYSDMSENIKSSNPKKLAAGLMVGEEGLLAIAVNYKYYTLGLPVEGYSGLVKYFPSKNSGKITFDLPSWIDEKKVQVYEVDENGFTPYAAKIEQGKVNISLDIVDSKIFFVGPPDKAPPEKPEKLRKFKNPVGMGIVLSWKDSYDNIGVKEYAIYKNGTEIARSDAPIYIIEKAADLGAKYQIRAFDGSGNMSEASVDAVNF